MCASHETVLATRDMLPDVAQHVWYIKAIQIQSVPCCYNIFSSYFSICFMYSSESEKVHCCSLLMGRPCTIAPIRNVHWTFFAHSNPYYYLRPRNRVIHEKASLGAIRIEISNQNCSYYGSRFGYTTVVCNILIQFSWHWSRKKKLKNKCQSRQSPSPHH